MIPAIYSNGKLVTGINHGEAFGKLTEEEQQNIKSGFIDPKTMRFIAECGEEFFLKKIYLIRHAQAEHNHITEKGRKQAKGVAAFLLQKHIEDYKLYSSPKDRCQETAEEISNVCHLPYEPHECLKEKEPEETIELFLQRIKICLGHLPEKCLLISHCDFIQKMVELISGKAASPKVPNCSSTYIENKEVIWYAKE